MLANWIGLFVIIFIGLSLIGPIHDQIYNPPINDTIKPQDTNDFMGSTFSLALTFAGLGIMVFGVSRLYKSLTDAGLIDTTPQAKQKPDNRTPAEKFADDLQPLQPPNVYANAPSKEMETAQG